MTSGSAPLASLELVEADRSLIDAALRDERALADALHAELAEGWDVFPGALVEARELLEGGPSWGVWGTMLFVQSAPRVLVGYGGFMGPPSPDGMVEIGYAIAEPFRGRGLATAASEALVRRAFADSAVLVVDAHTLPEGTASARVLTKVGFTKIGEAVDPDEGLVWHWRIVR